MEKYQVIILLDEARERSYFYSYAISEDTTRGNIECTELPPYADINKARSCYWDSNKAVWVFDKEKYAEICAEIEAIKEAQEEAQAIAKATPTNAELAEMVVEMTESIAELSNVLADVLDYTVLLENRLTMLEMSKED